MCLNRWSQPLAWLQKQSDNSFAQNLQDSLMLDAKQSQLELEPSSVESVATSNPSRGQNRTTGLQETFQSMLQICQRKTHSSSKLALETIMSSTENSPKREGWAGFYTQALACTIFAKLQVASTRNLSTLCVTYEFMLSEKAFLENHNR